jgi:type I restriction enzyme S subunit
MEVKKGYKKTEVGVIPEDWDVRKLSDISMLATGTTPSTKDISNYGSEFLFVSPQDLGEHKWIRKAEKALSVKGFSQARIFPANSILFTCIGSTIGKIGLTQFELTSNQQINAIFPKDSFDSEFLYYELDYLAPKIKLLAGQQAVPIINKEEFSKTLILLPKKNEQRAIAEALSDIDGLISSLTKLIDKKKKIKQGAMQELLTGKRRLEGFRGEWAEVQLGDIAQVTMGQSPDSRYYNTNSVGLPLVQGNADIEDRKTIKRYYTSQITRTGKQGDIIMTVRAPVGSVSKALFDCCLGRGVCSIRYPNEFLYHYLVFVEADWGYLSKGSTFDSVNSIEVKNLELIIPFDIEEQKAIANILSDMDAEIEALEIKLHKYKAIKKGMMQELLTGRIRLVEGA